MSPSRIPWTKVRHWLRPKTRAGPFRFLESRTATTPGRFTATSTQSPPLPPLRLLLCQMAPDRSTIGLLDDRADEIVRFGGAECDVLQFRPDRLVRLDFGNFIQVEGPGEVLAIDGRRFG